ncbi:MAG: MFS transporter, partial [Verrucomicrobia bacterium]|nr:MFS transporter [Verrucomicrobiota bacterium]
MRAVSIFSHDHPFYPVHITLNVILTSFFAIITTISTTISSTAIQGELALSNTEALWLTTLNLLGLNIMVPAANWFANQYGIHRTYTMGVAIYTVATLIAGLSTNFPMIATSRLIEGVGAGFIFPVGLSLIAQSVSKERTPLAINLYIGIAFGLGLAVGTTFAGYSSQFSSWRDIFFIITPLTTLAAMSCWSCRPPHPTLHQSPFDLWGFLSFAIFFSTLLVALTLAPIRSTPQGWVTPYIL